MFISANFSETPTYMFQRGYKGIHNTSMGSVSCPSNDDISPPTSELMPAVNCPEGNDLEEALREISREISSEFSCAKDVDPETCAGQSQPITLHCSEC